MAAEESTVFIQPSTGGQLELKIPLDSSVLLLKKTISNKLKVPKERIVLLHKNRQLVDGTLTENRVSDGSKLMLLPSVETGIAPQRPEQCVMQALENLNETQVDNFLAGRAPLNLTMRLGDHMMFIQLQLSTVSQDLANRSSSNSSGAPRTSSLPTPPTTPTTPNSPSQCLQFPTCVATSSTAPLSPPPSPKTSAPVTSKPENVSSPTLNSRALAEASKNLTHTLRQLSSAALNKKMHESCDGQCCKTVRPQSGAVIETMYHHGRGLYSGTFSGTLSPSLQDKDGRPRRDIGTVVHILNDLLGASAQCRPSSQCFCPTTSSSTSTPTATATTTTTQSLQQVLSSTLQVKVDGQQQQEENKLLKQKVKQIQLMLEERRKRRKTLRKLRSCPYTNTTTNPSQPNSPSNDVSYRNVEIGEQIMTDYSTTTAVA